MQEITCPNCGTVFQVDDNTYAAILSQVRNEVFNKEIERRTDEIQKLLRAEMRAEAVTAQKEADKKLSVKEQDINELKQTIAKLQGQIAGFDAEAKAQVAELKTAQAQTMAALEAGKNEEIAQLKAQIAAWTSQRDLDIEKERNKSKDELHRKEQTITQLQSRLESQKTAAQNHEMELREQHSLQLREKQEEIERLRDFKSRLSTKMVGETLEIHCSTVFEQAQSMGLFPNAYFDKDNDIRLGTKGDFIFRDFFDGRQYVSIMFEMKNEADTTATKHRNTDFLEKLDKDRRDKNCEYAVLVSMLEQGSDLYDAGIVDMSHRYPKMYVIRPQFFMPLLRIITQAAQQNLGTIMALTDELNVARAQSLDVTKLMEKVEKFKNAFGRNLQTAQTKYEAAMNGIDKIIDDLEKQIKALRAVKDNFQTSEQRLLKANEVLEEDFTIKKLTHGNPTMRAKLREAASRRDDNAE